MPAYVIRQRSLCSRSAYTTCVLYICTNEGISTCMFGLFTASPLLVN